MSALLDAARYQQWDKLVVRRPPWKLFGASTAFSASRMALKACCRARIGMEPFLPRPKPRRIHRSPRRACSHGPIIGLHAEIAL